MAGMTATWDLYGKDLLRERPQDFAQFILPGCRYITRHESQYQMREVRLDRLIEVEYELERLLINFELQATRDKKIGRRLLRYSLEALEEYELPVLSCVIHLQDVGELSEPPLRWEICGKRRLLWFDYVSIQLAEKTTQELREMNLLGLLPLFILSKDGRNFDVLDEVIERLDAAHERELLSLTRLFAEAAFTDKAERAYIARRFAMLQDIESTPTYQRLTSKGREEGTRQSALDQVRVRFPSLYSLAERQLSPITDLEVLRQAVIQIAAARSARMAREYLESLSQPQV
jgi:hypothetical protein